MPAERQDHPARTAAGRSFRALPKMVGGKVIDGDGDMRVLDGTKMERAATPAELKLSRKLRALAKGGGGKRRTRGPVTRRTRDRDALKAQALTNARKKVRRRPTTEAPSKAHMQKKGRAAWGRVDRVDMIDVPEGEDEMVGAEVDGLKIRLPRNGGRPYVDTENGPVPLDGVFVSRPEVDALLKGSKDTFDADKLTPEQHDAVQSAWGKVDRLHGGQTVSGEDRSVSVADITDSHGEKIVFTVPDRGGEVTVDYRRDRSEMTDDEIARGDDPWLTDQPTGIFLDEAEVDAKRQGKAAPELDAKRRRQVRQRTEAPVKPEGDDFDRANPNSDLSEKLIEDGGFTIDPADGSGPTVGYVVARPGHSKIMTREEFEAGGEHDINEYLRKLRDEEANPDVMLGGWYDARHDEIVLDRVEVVDSEDEAVRLGQERNEQAIWDLKGQREIPTGGTGTGADRKPVTPVSADSTDADVDRSFAEAVDAAVPEARRKRVADGGGPRGDTVKDAVAEDVVDMARESGMTDDQIRGALDRNGGPDGVDRASFDKALDRPRPDDMSGPSPSEGDVTAGRALALQRVKDAASTTPATSQPKPGSPDIPADVAGLPGVDSGSGTKEDPLRVSDMSTAVKLLGDGKYHIQLNRPDEVATLLDKVREETAKFKERGEKEPVFNLCLVSVPGANLYCADSVGYDRIRMPQLSTANPVPGSYADSLPRNGKGEVDLTEDFLKWLEEVKGIKVKRGTKVYASHLRASQAELRGGKVTGMMEGMKAGKVPPGVISQTSDGYIIDGHHRWAANVGLSMGGSNPVMETNTIDADIVTILALANQFASDMGSPPMAASVSGRTTKPVLFFAGVDRPEQSKAFTEVGWLTPDGFAPTPVWGDLPGTDPATVYVGDAPWAGMDPDGLYDSAVVMASPVFTTDAPDVADPPELVDPPDSAFG